MTAQTTVTYEALTGLCGDGTTPAAKLTVEGPDGSFDWVGGAPALEGLFDFLGSLRQVDHRVARVLSVKR